MSLKKRSTNAYHVLVNVLAFLSFVTLSFGQQVQSVIPASPTIGTLKQFNDYPMDYSTGTVNISVPIHTISAKDFSIPINMSFNARGRMGSLNYSPLGVGWGLTCIDYITRAINGKPDEYSTRIQQTKESLLNLGSGTDYNNKVHELYEKIIRADPERPTFQGNTITYPSYDISPDIYSFKVNGRSGKYIIDLDDHVVPLTYSTLKFNLAKEVMDESGNQYYFGTTPSAVENTTTANIGNQSQNLPSAWYLSQIVTAAGETITYNYESVYTGNVSGPIQSIVSAYNMYTYVKNITFTSLARNPLANALGSSTENVFRSNPYVIALLKSIVYPTGKVEFFYGSTDKKLESIKVFNTSNEVVKTVDFTFINTPGTSYLGNNNSISLSNMKIKGKNNSVEEQYNFEYYTQTLNYFSSLPYQQAFLSNVDWWGYCNSNGEHPPVIPTDNDFTQGQIGSKNANEQMKLSGMLKKIIYPTGGFTEFAFENNKCFSYGNSGTEIIDGPGLRIREIKSSTGTGAPLIKKISYATGTLPYIPNPDDFRTELKFPAYEGGLNSSSYSLYSKKTYTPFPASYVAKLYSMPVFYNSITEAQYNESGQALGKTEYFYETPESTTVINEDNYLKHVAVKEWTESRLKEKKIYKSVGTTNYSLQEHSYLQYTDLNYVNVPGIDFIRSNDVWYYFDPSQTSEPSGSRSGTYDEELIVRNGSITGIYTIINHPIESAIRVVSSEQVTKYEDGGYIKSSIKSYEYNNLINVLPTKETTTGSDGKLHVSEFKYTSDVAAVGNIYSTMVSSRNMVKNLIEQTDFVGGTQTNYVRTNYYAPYTNLFVPQNIMVKKGSGPLYPFIDFKRYNTKGGILEQQKRGEPNEVYFWGYQEQFPVAKVIGSDYATALTKLTQLQINTATSTASNDANVRTLLNNLRTIPGSMVSTFTYDPIIGITSQTDVRNRSTYYEYDNFSRLKNIRDNENNIIKRYDYGYASQNLFTKDALNAALAAFPQQREGRMNSFFNPSGIPRDQSLKDTRLFFIGGSAQLPDNLKKSPTFYSALNFNLSDPYYYPQGVPEPRFKFQDTGYSVEWRIKFPRNGYNSDVILIGINFNFQIQILITQNGTYLYGYSDFDGRQKGTAFSDPSFDILIDNATAFDNFQLVRLTITENKYQVYYNGQLKVEYPRTNTVRHKERFYADAGFLGFDGSVDYIRVMNAAGVEKFKEDFSDPDHPAIPDPSDITPTPAACTVAFTNYFNTTFGTTKTFSEIATIYLEQTGQPLSICQ